MGNDQGGKKGKKAEDQLFDAAFEMRSQAKQLEREAAKVTQSENKEKAKILVVRVNSDHILSLHIGAKKRKHRIRKALRRELNPPPQGGSGHPAFLRQARSRGRQARLRVPHPADLRADKEHGAFAPKRPRTHEQDEHK